MDDDEKRRNEELRWQRKANLRAREHKGRYEGYLAGWWMTVGFASIGGYLGWREKVRSTWPAELDIAFAVLLVVVGGWLMFRPAK